ncbi:Kinesin-like protein kif21b [Apophysomyces sp. BC1015]|nr:Kinesin-like protein kif21b [Apophysomyces sp. BC1015]
MAATQVSHLVYVRVGLRVRPLTHKEQVTNCTECLSFIPNEPQILIGTDKSFTYDYVFDSNTEQPQVYSTAAGPLLEKFLDGYNATILAYGQTGSGKTYSMGTGLDNNVSAENEGIVPRCVVELFRNLEERAKQSPDFQYEVFVSFLELYNEELIDLLSPQTAQKKKGMHVANTVEVTIREDVAASTDMNAVSSRSHAVFSVILKQQRPEDGAEHAPKKSVNALTSKFHFVDLAGSERLKRTNAQGDRAKEGIAINSGLLALGNVISALGDEARRTAHVPYRDSKLTRLLQDSLGGNSQTLMLACVSPADSNFMETLNTLKYANRARNIKNRVTINQDFAGSSIEVNQLRAQIARLRMEVASLRAENVGTYGGVQHDDDNRALRAEVMRLRERLQDLSTNMVQVTSERDTLKMERELGDFLANEDENDQRLNLDPASQSTHQDRIQTHPLIAQYQKTIQDLNNELADTRDRLHFLESAKSTAMIANSMPQSLSAISSFSRPTSLQKFSDLSNNPEQNISANTRRRKTRRRYNGRLSVNSSSTTSNARPARVVSKRTTRRAPLSQSSSTKTKRPWRQQRKEKQQLDDYDDEEISNNNNDTQDEEVRIEVKESIAKARAEIQKSMEMLELVKPLEDAANSWEEELKAFEDEEKRLYGGTELRRRGSDEGNFTSTPSPVDRHDNSDSDLLDELETLAVPSWDSVSKSTRCTFQSDSETKSASSGENNSFTSSVHSRTPSVAASAVDAKYNPQMVRMLHQIQSDIQVKEELVSHLEKSETAYTFMRRKFDEKVGHLQSQLSALQRERDTTVMRTKSGFSSKSEITVQMREKQQLIEIRHAYEGKMKNLLSEINELKRKYSQTTSTMQATRNQNESLLRSLRVNVETLKVEKKRMVKRMRQEADRVREQMTVQERKIQQLQRLNAEAAMARRRLEREHEAQKVTLKRRNEEVLMNNNQLKQLTSVLKKAVREGGVLDERLLGKVSHIMGGSFAVFARGGSLPGKKPRRKNPIPVQVRASRKKQLLDRALGQYIQGKQAVVEMEQLLFRRERLASEKLELVEERRHIYLAEKENSESTGQPMETMALEFTDERIELIEAEISYLSARIRALQSEAAGESLAAEESAGSALLTESRPEKRVTFADEIVNEPAANDEWADMDALEEQFNVPSSAAPEIAYDITAKLLKSLEADECKSIAEALVDDIMNVRMSECNRQVTMQNLEKTVMDLRRTLVVMKRAAIATTIENERRIRKLQEKNKDNEDDDEDSAIDVKIEEYINGGNTIFDKIYEDGLRGMITTPEPGMDYALNDSPASSVIGSSGSHASHTSHELGLIPPPSPLTSPVYTVTSPSKPTHGVKPPVSLTDKNRASISTRRDSTPSPDRFYNMIQKRLSWQQRMGGSESPIPMTIVNQADFARYTADRESSTSSIRSSHLRRSSVQSDYSSSQNSWNHTTSSASQGSLRKRAFSLQQPPVPTRRRASLRELSLMGGPPGSATNSEYEPSSPSLAATVSYQRGQHYHPPPPKRPSFNNLSSITSMSTALLERSGTPSGHNVFDRLSQTPTRASQAKRSYRHSSGSIEDLRLRFELERSSSGMSGTYYGEQ